MRVPLTTGLPTSTFGSAPIRSRQSTVHSLRSATDHYDRFLRRLTLDARRPASALRQRSAAPMRLCLFCKNGRLTLEHVWARWLTKQLKAELFRVVTQTPSSSGTTRFTKELDMKARAVCKKCNGGCMSALEAEGVRRMHRLAGRIRDLQAKRLLGRCRGNGGRLAHVIVERQPLIRCQRRRRASDVARLDRNPAGIAQRISLRRAATDSCSPARAGPTAHTSGVTSSGVF